MLSDAARDEIRAIVKRYPEDRQKSAVMPALYVAQAELGHITPEATVEVAELLRLPPAHVRAVITFYTMFEPQPTGGYIVDVCTCTSCHLKGAYNLLEHLERRLGIQRGQTTADGKITLREQECIGACANAPALQVNYRFHEDLTEEKVDALLDELLAGEGTNHA